MNRPKPFRQISHQYNIADNIAKAIINSVNGKAAVHLIFPAARIYVLSDASKGKCLFLSNFKQRFQWSALFSNISLYCEKHYCCIIYNLQLMRHIIHKNWHIQRIIDEL